MPYSSQTAVYLCVHDVDAVCPKFLDKQVCSGLLIDQGYGKWNFGLKASEGEILSFGKEASV